MTVPVDWMRLIILVFLLKEPKKMLITTDNNAYLLT